MKNSASLTTTRIVGFLAILSGWRVVQFAQFPELGSLLIILGATLLVIQAGRGKRWLEEERFAASNQEVQPKW